MKSDETKPNTTKNLSKRLSSQDRAEEAMVEGLRVCAMVQARVDSARLRGKVLRHLGKKPILLQILHRLQRAALIDELMVVTTRRAEDDAIATLCEEASVPCMRGANEDVLQRFASAAKKTRASHILRITADCPLIDPVVIDQLILLAAKQLQDPLKAHQLSLYTNVYPRTFARGLDCELFSQTTLAFLHQQAKERHHREHVTLYAYDHPEQIELYNLFSQKNQSYLRLTIDEPYDLEMLSQSLALYEHHFGKDSFVSTPKLIELLLKHPEIYTINANVKQAFEKNTSEEASRANEKDSLL